MYRELRHIHTRVYITIEREEERVWSQTNPSCYSVCPFFRETSRIGVRFGNYRFFFAFTFGVQKREES